MRPTLRLTGICKSFGPIRVLDQVNLEAFPGEVHILAGENGAGKSTLMKILAGVYSQYEGSIELEDKVQHFERPLAASLAGISVIHQEMSLIREMSVLDNLFLGRALPFWQSKKLKARLENEAKALCREFDLDIDLNLPVESFSIGIKNQIEILKALTFNSKVLVMDEPSSALGSHEVERMFKLIERLKSSGCAIIYISHKMEEIYRIADRITVLRDGKSVGTALARDLPQAKLIEWMIGRELKEQFPTRKVPIRDEVKLETKNFCGVDLAVRAGEIVGIAGLQGSGKSELVQALFSPDASVRSLERDKIKMDGRNFRLNSPKASIRQSVMLLTNDRKETGLVLGLSIEKNLTLASLDQFSKWGFLDPDAEKKAAQKLVSRMRIKSNSLEQAVGELSGGNQQKVALGKCVQTGCKVLLLDEPTRGVDVGAKHEIYELIYELAASGCAIVLITSEMPECLALSDRILVMHRGKVSARFTQKEATQEKILQAAMGEHFA